MTIEDYRIVIVTYEVREGGPDGLLLERMDANYPFKFMFGTGRMLPAWERQLFGLKAGMGFTFTLPPNMAYGMPSAAHVLDVPLEVFRNEAEQIQPGLIE
ncbi:MAG: FKBP-type peptidyl-prolyl cis-trans isomerase, partial [Bacteroidota bacterium]